MENDHHLRDAIQRSLFDEPVDLYNYNQITPIHSPSLSFSRMVQASRSVPGSRRNSNDDHTLDLLLGKKLSLNDRESSFSSRKFPFAMTPIDPIGSSKRQSQISSLDTFSTDSDVPLFNPLLAGNTKESPSHHFSTLSTTSTSNPILATNETDDYAELFTMTHVDHHEPLTTVGSNWIPPAMMMTPKEPEKKLPGRYTYGWHTDNHVTQPNRLVNSHSFHDLTSMSFQQQPIVCPNQQEFGFCSRQPNCPFTHPIGTTYQPYIMNPPQQPTVKNKSKKSQQQPQQQDRFADAKLDDFIGKLYELCKDQNGCRFLQRKIEESARQLELIFNEIYTHFTGLMTDPFGNYLCQKMLEKCNNDQRTSIIEIVSKDLTQIALNMHGTRAVQKLIEYLSTQEQIKLVTEALNPNVVVLIKDLNGNHVIQKCLYRLSAENNQFIYDAVCKNCIEVASHKHGCCVLQRCFDYATLSQKEQLVNEISKHALPLVQNAFGNYVVQYVLELGVPEYSESVITRFVNHVYILSIQKFSSNVIENCIRTARPETRRLLIEELINPTVMQKLLHDSFANYVVQTSLDFADQDQREKLIECIKPLLPTIRTTPYGKRIYSKIYKSKST